MKKRVLTKEDIDKVRDIEGFPVGSDEDINALSNAPYYTACPNPFMNEFIKENGKPYDEETDNYHCEPFAADVSEGKADPIYNAHSYPTKVLYKAIMRYILHYTKPGDIVFDGFCGTGMTGVAAQMCATDNTEVRQLLSTEIKGAEFGERKAILSDLSPAASFIAYNYNTPIDLKSFYQDIDRITAEAELDWLYKTRHKINQPTLFDDKPCYGRINYTVWSDVLICPSCGKEIVYYNAAFNKEKKGVNDSFLCSYCGLSVKKGDCEHAQNIIFDKAEGKTHALSKQVPVLISYYYGGKRYEKIPDEEDFDVLRRVEEYNNPYWFPTDLVLGIGEKWGDLWRAGYHFGIRRAHHFYTKRHLLALSCLREKCKGSRYAVILQSIIAGLACKMSRYNMGKRGNGPMNGLLYIPSLMAEADVLKLFRGKADDFYKAYELLSHIGDNIIQCCSATELRTIPSNSVDYIFTDPLFGDNLMYSELSFLWEAWLKCFTNNKTEAIICDTQHKSIVEYQTLMTECLSEFFRILKPNRWITVEFHNSKNAVWNALQEALQKAGFVVADVRTLDKKQGSYKQVINTMAVKQDLVISAYKPKQSFREQLLNNAGTVETVWAFVQQHLEKIPVVVIKNERIEIVAERQAYLLFDRMVAYHIMQGIPVPMDATDFYRGLDEKYLKRDNIYFLPDQVNEYDTARIVNDIEPIQFSLFVTNEKTAIAWLYQNLGEENGEPQTYSELQPKFMQEVKSVDRYEDMPELAVLLEENFLQDKEERWYIPDATKEGDLIKLREKKLWKEFEGYLNSKGKLKLFRSEAIRVGFARLWKDKNYKAIVDITERLPEQTIQEDQNLLMYYDISLGRI